MTETIFGTSVERHEDIGFLSGTAQFTADIKLPGMAYMSILRSDYAHARIVSIDTTAAAQSEGVIRVITGQDIADKIMPLPCIWKPGGGAESHFPPHPYGLPGAGTVMQSEVVRYIGDVVAVVVAEAQEQADRALDAITVEYEPLPVVINAERALDDGAPQLHEAVPGNLNAYCAYGEKESAEKAIAEADVVVKLSARNQRTINNPIEPRAAVAQYDANKGDFTFWGTSQSPYNHRLLLAFAILGIPYNKLRMISPNIGGSFGTKGYIYPDMPLILFLARELNRPIKWVDTRRGMMRSTVQGRDQLQHGTLAGTKDGKITGLYATHYANLGAYPSTIGPGVATAMVGRSMTSVYDIESAFSEVYAVFTNIVPLGAQRGSGRSEATYLIERLIDLYAKDIGMDPAEVRRKNLIQADQFPFDNGLGWLYDSGDYEAAFDLALEKAGYADVDAKRAEARSRGKRLGVGVTPYVAICGVGPSPRMAEEGMLGGTWEATTIRVAPTGEISLTIGSIPHGQSHETTMAQVVAQELGVPMEMIEVLHSDTKAMAFGQGSYGSRSFSVCGASVDLSAKKIKKKMIDFYAHANQVSADAVRYEDGQFSVEGKPESALPFQQVAMGIWYGWSLPPGMEPNLEVSTFFDPPDFNYPFGTQVALVEVDEQTGEVEVVQFISVCDVGNVANPKVVEGQIQGGVAHGLGQALMEEAVYNDQGNLVNDNFMEYPLPRASQMLDFESLRTVTPTQHNSLGAKGAGEIGTVGVTAAVASAICDALSDLNVRHIDMPFTPERVWMAIQEQKAQPTLNGYKNGKVNHEHNGTV